MTKPSDELGKHLRFFLAEYLPRQRNASTETIHAYRDALKLFLLFAAKEKRRAVVRLTLADVDRATVLGFLEWIERERNNGSSTRNHRLSVIHSFFRCVAQSIPEAVEGCAQIMAIPQKRTEHRSIDYLTLDEMASLIRQIPSKRIEDQRDDALVRFLYNTGARVQEAVTVMASDLRLDSPPHVLLYGKGRKERLCPLWPDTAERLQSLLNKRCIGFGEKAYVFTNRKGERLTRFGVRYILAKYVRSAIEDRPDLVRKRVHPHCIRHTTALHLLQSGVDLNTVRCWLGHASVTTTNKYVEIDLEMKRRAIDKMAIITDDQLERTVPDDTLIKWLESL